MITVARSALVAHSAAAMFALVDDVASYPQFLPWCSQAEIEHQDAERTVATLHIAYRGIHQQFTTENIKQPGKSIQMRLLRGPFKSLEGEWQFVPLAEAAARVELRLEYQFANALLDRLIGPAFSHIANTFVDAFVQRAEALYGAQA
jgi:ribosome-associated toxin RatA of RatAB toxin-antitoxin module